MADDSGRESVDEIVSSSLLVLSGDHAAHEALDLHVAGWNTDDEEDTRPSEVVEQDQEQSVGATEEMLDDAEIDQLLLAASQVTGEEVGSARLPSFWFTCILRKCGRGNLGCRQRLVVRHLGLAGCGRLGLEIVKLFPLSILSKETMSSVRILIV